MVHLGVDYDPMEYLRSPLTYCYGMYDLSAATDKLRGHVYHGGDDGYLIYVPSHHAPDFAPDGKHCVTLYTHMDKSSFGGVVPIWNQKNPPHETPIKGLYFVGQQSENGGGVCPVMLGGRAAWHKAKKRL